MMRSVILAALFFTPMLATAQNVGAQREANAKYLKGVQKYAEARSTEDVERSRSLLSEALEDFAGAHEALISDVHQSRLMKGLTLKALGRMDEALEVFEALADSPNEAVREHVQKEKATILESLGEAEWARLELECGLARVSVRLDPTDVVGENVTVADRLGQWVPCKAWEAVNVVRPGQYNLFMRREPAGEGERGFTTRRKLDLGIGDRQRVLVHFEVAPPPVVDVYPCGCNSGPECRSVRVWGAEGK